MAKRTGENQDYYKHAGQDPGRRLLERERKKVSEARVSGEGPRGAASRKVSAKASGAATQTAELTRKRRLQREAREVEHDEVQRMVESEAPVAPPDHMLPPARPSTEFTDLWRSVEQSAAGARRAGRGVLASLTELGSSLGELLWAPVRLVRLFRASI
ncbi:MAG: hypothetical protein HY901_03730 [Deltaproteobacteria bacterium]|nr:hypothetical protein [Deltaproteobacteria bacterium]